MNAVLIFLIPVFLPIIGGFLMLFLRFRNDRARNIFTEIVTCVTSVLVWNVLLRNNLTPVTIYSFTQDFSITVAADGMGRLFAGMLSLMWPCVLLYMFSYMHDSNRKNIFYCFYTITYGITLGVAFSGNMTTLYVFYEMLSLVTIPLVTHYGNHESMYAGRIYAAYTIGGASLTFFAVVLTTISGGSGSFILGGNLGADADIFLMRLAFVLGFFGFGTKAAVFPLHYWLPTASAAPTPVTALLHAVAVVNTGAFSVIRLIYFTFGTDILIGSWAQDLCLATAIFSLLFAAVKAIREKHFKRRLAYSTMSNLSYMLFGAMLLTPAGLTGALSHMVFHGVIKMSLFLCAGAFMHCTGKNYIYKINGVGKRMPVTFICYTLGALSLTGIPLFCGFVSKWKLMTAGAEADTTLSLIGVCALIVSAFLCAIYSLTISVRAFFPVEGKDCYEEEGSAHEAEPLMLIPIVFFTVVNIALGIWSGPLVHYIEQISVG
ncbi:MAG: proton-conducting transporter membrane subunit [Lachnospiraceae bacterium]|nr:proton-conducting transporter membrane subunit [Lachnospiraceae bacterium]